MVKRAAAKKDPSLDELIHSDDFKTMQLKINLVNTTTKTEIRNGKRVFGINASKIQKDQKQVDLSIQVVEFLEEGYVLEVPSHVCAVGHSVSLETTATYKGQETIFQASGKVEEVEKLPNSREQIRVHFTQFKSKEWQDLLQAYMSRQNEVFNFFESSKD